MYGTATRTNALRLLGAGLTISETSRQTGVSRAQIRQWRERTARGLPLYAGNFHDCPRCSELPRPPDPPDAYAYLLGQYLGDGCISRTAKEGVYALRIACADSWPGVRAECEAAMRAVRPGNKVCAFQKPGCSDVKSYSKHWPCLFPQHGPGRKHERRIVLEAWQEDLLTTCSPQFVRGLIHSDGYRGLNRVRSGGKVYEYPRYLFVNESEDIRGLFIAALDRLGVEWKRSKRNTVSVARREAVARMDGFVGAKY